MRRWIEVARCGLYSWWLCPRLIAAASYSSCPTSGGVGLHAQLLRDGPHQVQPSTTRVTWSPTIQLSFSQAWCTSVYERCTARTANANDGVLSGYGRRRRCSADSSRMVAQPVIIALINWAILVSDKSLFCDCEMDSRRLLDDGASVLHRQSFGEFHERL